MIQGMKILLVEDEAINQMLMTALLTQFGFEVTAVENGKKAVEAVAREEYQLILMDLQMPDMDGFEATRRIKAMTDRPNLPPIIALTAHAMGKDREKCLQAGMDDYLSKPIGRDELYHVLVRHLAGNRANSPSSTACRSGVTAISGIIFGAFSRHENGQYTKEHQTGTQSHKKLAPTTTGE